MASKQRWSTGVGSRDVYELMDALEQMTLTTIRITLVLRNSHGTRGPWLRAEAFTRASVGVEPVLLGYAELKCSTTEFGSLDPAGFHVLYALDSMLDEKLRNEESKNGAAPAKVE